MLDWAQDKIRRARAEGWTLLNLEDAGLTAIPEEVWSLEELEVLALGGHYYHHQHGPLVGSENRGWQRLRRNTITVLPDQMAHLSRLRELYLNGNKIVDVGPLVALTALTSLSLRGSQVQDVGPLAALTALTSLDLSLTQVQDVGPLAALTALTSLNLSGITLLMDRGS